MTAEMRGGGEGEVAAKRAKASDDNAAAGEDLLSALPDDVLALILLHLSTEDAVRTSALARRWRKVWTLLPVLRFAYVRDSRCVRTALSASQVPLRHLLVGHADPSPGSLPAWLPAAARRVSGALHLFSFGTAAATTAADGEAAPPPPPDNNEKFELPCFDKATSIRIELPCFGSLPLGLAVPPEGVFQRLTDLSLHGVRFHGPGDLGDAVSSPRCPCLERLAIRNVRGLDAIAIRSDSLQRLELKGLRGVRQVTVVAPALKDFSMLKCFIHDRNQPVASISAPQLQALKWVDAYDPTSVQLATNTDHLHMMATLFFVYGPHGFTHNRACLNLLPRFKAIDYLILSLAYLQELDNLQYAMEDMTTLPDVASLHLIVMAEGHSLGACSFHILRICSGIKCLILDSSSNCFDSQKPFACSPDCVCDQPTNWKTENISLNRLQELEIKGFGASDHEVAFVKRLLNWVPVLKMMTVTFNHSVNGIKARELFQMFRGFSRPGLCMKFFTYQKFRKVVFAPED